MDTEALGNYISKIIENKNNILLENIISDSKKSDNNNDTKSIDILSNKVSVLSDKIDNLSGKYEDIC